jgi:hypothetical protein
MIFLQGFIKFDQGISEKSSGQTCVEAVGQTLPQLPWKQTRGDLRNVWIPFIKLHETL